MEELSKIREYVPIPAKAATSSHPGRTLETKAERELRYDAQLIAERHGVPMTQAMGIARHRAAALEKDRRAQESRKEKENSLARERRHDERKKDTTPIHKTVGPPLQGGAPGLGKGQ